MFLTQSEVALLRVHVVVLLVAPCVNEVADDERNARVWQLLSSATETVEKVSLEHTRERVLLERRHSVCLDTLLGWATKSTPPSDLSR